MNLIVPRRVLRHGVSVILATCAAGVALAIGACESDSVPSASAPAVDAHVFDAPAATDAPVADAPMMEAAADVTVADASDAADGAPPVVPLVTGTYAAGAAWGPSAAGGYPGGIWGGQTVTFNGAGALLSISNATWSISTSDPIAEYGADGLVAWGRWTTGTTNMGGSPAATKALNYIAGVQAPSTGVLHASYSAFASTAPTGLSGATTATGNSNTVTGTVSVSGGTVTIALGDITVGGHTFAIAASTGFYATTGMLAGGTVTSSTGGCASGCTGSITNAGALQGWFFGTNGERVAINFGFSSSVGDVSGAVVLK